LGFSGSDRGSWREATVADLDGSGQPQIAVAVDNPAGLKLVRCPLFRHDCRLPLITSVTTLGTPRLLRTGDFDGDGVDDLAFVDPLPDGDRVEVAYGGRGAPPEVRPVIDLPHVTSLEPAYLHDPDGFLDGAEDLLLQSERESGQRFEWGLLAVA